MNNELKSTAYHEAAHAVFDILFGFGVEYVTIIPTDEYMGKCVKLNSPKYITFEQIEDAWISGEITDKEANELGFNFDSEPIIDLPEDGKKYVQTLLAGYIAEGRINGKNTQEIFNGAESDFENAIPAVWHGYSKEQAQKILNSQLVETRNLLNEHWNIIEVVAEALMEKKTLTGDEVKKIATGTV